MTLPLGGTTFVVGIKGSDASTWEYVEGKGRKLADRRLDAMETFFAAWCKKAGITVEAGRRMLGLEEALRLDRYMRHRPGYRKTAATEAAYKKRRDQLQTEIEGLRRGELLVPKDVFSAKDDHERHRIMDCGSTASVVSAMVAPRPSLCYNCGLTPGVGWRGRQ